MRSHVVPAKQLRTAIGEVSKGKLYFVFVVLRVAELVVLRAPDLSHIGFLSYFQCVVCRVLAVLRAPDVSYFYICFRGVPGRSSAWVMMHNSL